MIDLSRHRFDALAHDDECILYRARSEEDGSEAAFASSGAPSDLGQDAVSVFSRDEASRTRVLVLAPAVQYPAPDVLKRLEHEYSLREELDREWAVRPLTLNRRGGQVMLVLEDPSSAAASLDRFLRPARISEGGSEAGGQPMELGRFLRLAVNLAAGLDKLHRRGLIHKDIKPTHILVDLETNKVWFTGFGISSRLARERQAAESPEVIAGTLAYMAPEQTGRMNRSIDSRSDLYSLGVTFYQMLTGALPFAASDPMEWVHCHVARQPAPPAERRTGFRALSRQSS